MGLRGVMASLGMMPAPNIHEKKQLLFSVKSRFEANPSVGGYLRSKSTSPATSDAASSKASCSPNDRYS